MMFTIQYVLHAVCVALCLTSQVMGSHLEFTSTPTIIKHRITDALTVRCSLSDGVLGNHHSTPCVKTEIAPSNVTFVHSIIISKGGVELASVSGFLPAKVLDDTRGAQVTGQTNGTGEEKAFLQVIWQNPGFDETGNYKCEIRGTDENGHGHDFSKTLDVVQRKVSLEDLVEYVHQMKLENADLRNRLDTHVMFTAILSSPVTSANGVVVVFDQLRTSVGGGYDVTSGVFTAPVPGYYTFHVHVLGQRDKFAEVRLLHNGELVTTALADDGYSYNSATTSATLRLGRGHEVKVTSYSVSYIYGSKEGYSSFSGRLVALL